MLNITHYSVQFSCSVVSDSLRPHELQHAKPPCPSPTPRVYSYSCPWSQWCHPAISSSVVPFSSCPQSLPASGSFPMSQLFAWGAKVLEFQLQHQSFQWTPRTNLIWDGLVGSPCSKFLNCGVGEDTWESLRLQGDPSLLAKCKSKPYEVSSYSSQNGHHQKVYKQKMLERVSRKGNPPSQLVGITGTVTMENSVESPKNWE